MPEISVTDAARNLSRLLDAIERDGAEFTLMRRGHAVAHLGPLQRGRGSDVKAVLRNAPADSDWQDDVASTRRIVTPERGPVRAIVVSTTFTLDPDSKPSH